MFEEIEAFSTKVWLETQCYYALNYPFYEMTPHSHAAWEIMYVVHGKCQIYYLNEKQEKISIKLRDGNYVLVDGNVSHQLQVDKESPCRVLNIEARLVKSNGLVSFFELMQSHAFCSFLQTSGSVCVGDDDDALLHGIIVALQKELQNKSESAESQDSELLTCLLWSQLLLTIARQFNTKKRGLGHSVYVRRASAFINEHFDEEITVACVAKAAAISEAYLQHLFRKETNSSLVEQITALRINKAKLLLENSSLPITDIAISVGFNNRQHFSLLFSRIVKCSPSVYRHTKGNIFLKQQLK